MKYKLFSAGWCQPCSMLKKTISSLEGSMELDYEIIDVDNSPEDAAKYRIRSVPTLLKLNEDGEVLEVSLGNKTKQELLSFMEVA